MAYWVCCLRPKTNAAPGTETDMEGIFESIITKNMAMLATAAIAVLFFIGKIPLKSGGTVNQTKFWSTWGVFVLLGFCLAGAFMPGVSGLEEGAWGDTVVFALVASIVAHLGRAVLKPVLFRKLEGKNPVEKSPSDEL